MPINGQTESTRWRPKLNVAPRPPIDFEKISRFIRIFATFRNALLRYSCVYFNLFVVWDGVRAHAIAFSMRMT